jgi:hypothetical protein
MGAMRVVAALAVVVSLAAAGCGSSTAPTSGTDAAALVPPDAIAFVTVDANLDSEQWRRLDKLTQGLRLRARVLETVRKALREKQLDFHDDVRPAFGGELDVAVLAVGNDEFEAIVLTQPEDEAKLRSLVAAYDEHAEGYRVERIGDWSVVADSAEAFAAVRRAESGRSLADVADFQAAQAQLESEALATAYADGAELQRLPGGLGALVRVAGSPRWVAARLAAEQDAVRLDVHAARPTPLPAVYRPRLLRDVPSGAILAVSFKDAHLLLKRLALDGVQRALGIRLQDLAPALRGEGVFYVVPSSFLPIFVLEVESPNPQASARSLQRLARGLSAKTGNALALHVVTRGNHVLLTNGLGPAPTTGGRLVDDEPFKAALDAADVPGEVTWLAYADVQRLIPLAQALSQLLGRAPPRASDLQGLDQLGTLVAFGARTGSTSRLGLRLTIR